MSLLFEPTPDGAGRYLDWILNGLCWTLLLALGAWTHIAAVVDGSALTIQLFHDGIASVPAAAMAGVVPDWPRLTVHDVRLTPLTPVQHKWSEIQMGSMRLASFFTFFK